MIKIDKAVIVEGKYDKITLENIIDATIITTDGFGIFKNEGKRKLIRRLATEKGIIVLTDSDSSGAVIRSYIKKICPQGSITNVYIPQISGKERRKTAYAKEGLLGVEGMSETVITEAFERSGICFCNISERRKIQKNDLYELGLSGGISSAEKRRKLSVYLRLPDNLSSNAFLDAVNAIYSFDDFFEAVKNWRQEVNKN